MTNEEIDAFLREPLTADFATLRPDGSPHVTPVWFYYDGTKVLVISNPSAVKVRNIRHDPRVSLCIATDREPYKQVQVRGTAEVSDEGVPETVRSMSVHYKGPTEGPEYADQVLNDTAFCVITVTPSAITGKADGP